GVKRPIRDQVRDLARQAPRVNDLMSELAAKHRIHLAAGTIPVCGEGDEVFNDSHFYFPDGQSIVQGKLHMTRFEREEWMVSPRTQLRVIETEFGRLAIAVCYDVEFPEIARAAAAKGAHILVVPSCT